MKKYSSRLGTLGLRALMALTIFLMTGMPLNASEPTRIRAGHFATITHAPALLGRATGDLDKALSPIPIVWKRFNAGPSALEALFAGELDILYVGPNPAILGYVRSHGDALRIIAGVANGGSALVVHKRSGIHSVRDLAGRRLATPQIGNSQDVALRYLLVSQGLKERSFGGDVSIFNLSGGDQITALERRHIDGVWAVEPWITRLLHEADGEILIDEKTLWASGVYPTAVLIASRTFLEAYPELAAKWVDAHRAVIRMLQESPDKALPLVNTELKLLTGKELPLNYLKEAMSRIVFSPEIPFSALLESVKRTAAVGFFSGPVPSPESMIDTRFLQTFTKESASRT